MLAEYQARCRVPSLQGKVRFIGFHPDSKALLGMSEIFVLPTLLELHSIAVLEALYMKVPVVTSRGVGRHDEFIHSWENGVLLDPLRPDDWGDAMLRLLADGELRRRIGEAGHETCRREFDIRQVAGRLEQVYGDLAR